MVRSSAVVSSIDDLPEHEVIRLLMVTTGATRSDVLLGFDVDESAVSDFENLVERRRNNEPLQYIEGSVRFGSVNLHVDPRVLIPRPETEYMLELVLGMVESPRVIVDLCTGSGNLALALAAEFRDADVYATDLSRDAVSVARANAQHNDVDVDISHGDLFDPLPLSLHGCVDLVVSNPPYLAESEVDGLAMDVRAEPAMALIAGERGDEVLMRIAESVGSWLSPGGLVFCEMSEFHGPVIAEHFGDFDPTILVDLAGRDRYVVGRRNVG